MIFVHNFFLSFIKIRKYKYSLNIIKMNFNNQYAYNFIDYRSFSKTDFYLE